MTDHPATRPPSGTAVLDLLMGPRGPRRGPATALTVRAVDPDEHAAAAEAMGASVLQLPRWARCKPGWAGVSLGWFDAADRLVGVALVLLRPVPRTRRCLAYLPEGPVLPWDEVAADPDAWLDPLVEHLRARGAFAVRIGPQVPHRDWRAETVRAGTADPGVHRLDDLPADVTWATGGVLSRALAARGWRGGGTGEGFSAGQPRHRLQVDLLAPDGAPPQDAPASHLWDGLTSPWRRNVTRARSRGVVVRVGGAQDLPTFVALYQETAERDGFRPRPPQYFERMWQALSPPGPGHLRLVLAELDGQALAAALLVRVGDHVWYSYGASTARRRDVRASNALQWWAIEDAAATGCAVYDMRGIGATLDPSAPLAGLLRFKLGTGGTVREGVGEWELPLSPLWWAAYSAYTACSGWAASLRRRS